MKNLTFFEWLIIGSIFSMISFMALVSIPTMSANAEKFENEHCTFVYNQPEFKRVYAYELKAYRKLESCTIYTTESEK